MSPPGVRRSRRREPEDGSLDRRHPFENTQRFSSPSRPHGNNQVEHLRKLGIGIATFTMIQSLLWIGLSTAAMLVYRGIIPTPAVVELVDDWTNLSTMLTYLYFKEGAALPPLPMEGLVSPLTMYRMMASEFVINVFWFITSAVMFAKIRSGGPTSWVVSVRVWAFSTVAVVVMDVVLGAAMIRDMVALQDQVALPNVDSEVYTTIRESTAVVMVIALRAGLILITNVVLMIALLYLLANRLNPPKNLVSVRATGDSPSATRREGPIDAFLFLNNSEAGVINSAFVPDNAPPPTSATAAPGTAPPANWSSFRPPPDAPRASGKKLKRITSRELKELDAQLAWMEEPQRHADVEFRRQPGWPGPSTPPVDDSVFEPAQPEDHKGHGPDFGFSYLLGPGHMLPRARLGADGPRMHIPPPDYSPPARRATVQRGPRRGPRPVPPVAVPAAPVAPAAPAAVHLRTQRSRISRDDDGGSVLNIADLGGVLGRDCELDPVEPIAPESASVLPATYEGLENSRDRYVTFREYVPAEEDA